MKDVEDVVMSRAEARSAFQLHLFVVLPASFHNIHHCERSLHLVSWRQLIIIYAGKRNMRSSNQSSCSEATAFALVANARQRRQCISELFWLSKRLESLGTLACWRSKETNVFTWTFFRLASRRRRACNRNRCTQEFELGVSDAGDKITTQTWTTQKILQVWLLWKGIF